MRVHAKSPLRLGLAGGGTDVAPYSDLYGGLVLNATISLFTHCDISFATDGMVHFTASDFDASVVLPAESQIPIDGALILHKAVYRSIISKFNNGKPLALHVTTYSDAPPGSGVGSSSSLVVCMIEAYRELLNLPLGEYDVAHLAYEIERIDCAMAGGKQDQYAAAFGGFNFMEFRAGDKVIVNPLRLKPALANELESKLLLYYTGQSRESAKIIESQIAATQVPSSPAIAAMHDIRQAATDMKEALLMGRINEVLSILGSSWQSKKRAAANITNSYIDEIALVASTSGASGLKISGAGGGGFMMIAVDPMYRLQVIRALERFSGRFFTFTFTELGAQSWKSK